MEQKIITPVGYIKTDFNEKFGIPRQSGRSPSCTGEIILTNEFNSLETVKELENFSHIWLLFDFSECKGKWLKSVRPPKLGGNKKVGVFASRSPFRPNGIGLSCVKLEKIEQSVGGVKLTVSGADLLNGTPVYDIKPYIPYTDCRTEAKGGYSENFKDYKLKVEFPQELLCLVPQNKRNALIECLQDDPRPGYQNDDREYGFSFANLNVKFTVNENTLKVTSVEQK